MAGVAFVLTSTSGCKSTNTAPPDESGVRAVSHNPIAHISDLVALTNSICLEKRVAYFTFEMNDQSYQPFYDAYQSITRRMFPMWTDVDLKCNYTNKNGEAGEFIFSTVFSSNGIMEESAPTNSPYVSVEIAGVYENTPDVRLNVRISYTKYSSIANFLYANGMEGVTFESLHAANVNYAGIQRGEVEYGHWWDVFQYAPKRIVMKVDFNSPDKQMFHSENPAISFSYNRRVGIMHRETGKVNGSDKIIWTPVFPHWVRLSYFNEFAKDDIQ